MSELMTRDNFRTAVFTRDKHLCVICKALGQDAHHIMERRLFSDGGYYIDNGATLCGPCHLKAESTEISTDEIRLAACIISTRLPSHLYGDTQYDKWGNVILRIGVKMPGELFWDPSVRRILGSRVEGFSKQVKYPRTWHLPWSPGGTNDDRRLDLYDVERWTELHKGSVITEKMDGENTNMYTDYIHARSIDYNPHPSRAKIKALHASIAHNIPQGWRVCGENLTAVHSIKYTDLYSIFQVFSIWDEFNTCLSWEDTVLYTELLGLRTVPVLAQVTWSDKVINMLEMGELNWHDSLIGKEGYVVRPAGSFTYREFPKVVGKYVRANHVHTHGHWMKNKLEYNLVNGL